MYRINKWKGNATVKTKNTVSDDSLAYFGHRGTLIGQSEDLLLKTCLPPLSPPLSLFF